MLKLITSSLNRKGATLWLGLSLANRQKLGRDMPIKIDLNELTAGGAPMPEEIVLVGGARERDIITQLRSNGLPIPPDAEERLEEELPYAEPLATLLFDRDELDTLLALVAPAAVAAEGKPTFWKLNSLRTAVAEARYGLEPR